MAHSKDLVAASATPIILSILSRGDSYGYAIIEEVRRISGGNMQWADGMLYPILHRLEHRGLVSSYSERAENGRRRKYYRIERKGRSELAQLRDQWTELHRVIVELGGDQPCLT
jgi:DNA-binding PadR family transcriptional regulator